LRLIAGAVTVGIGFWAVDSLERSVTRLVLWVGIAALFRGVNQIFLAFEFRHLHEATKPSAASSQMPVNVVDLALG
jgi:uncharacterized membrane protein HdeD (DUF308 family)